MHSTNLINNVSSAYPKEFKLLCCFHLHTPKVHANANRKEMCAFRTDPDGCSSKRNSSQRLSMNSPTVTGDIRVGKVILSAWLGTCMHTHSHTGVHCSVSLPSSFTPGAMNQFERESQRGLFKVNRVEQISIFWSDLLVWHSTPSALCMSGPSDGPGWWRYLYFIEKVN